MSNTSFFLRPFQPQDSEQVVEVLIDTLTTTWKPRLSSAALAEFDPKTSASKYVGARGMKFIVAIKNDQVIGIVDYHENFINALHVRCSYQRQGVGHALMNNSEKSIRTKGHNSVRLETDTFNTQSRNFYRQRNFYEIDTYPDTEWNSGIITLLLEKKL